MFRAFRTEWYEKKLKKLSDEEQKIVEKIEQDLKQNPLSGKPLGYSFFRERKFDGNRIYFLVYLAPKVIFLITISDKKAQQQVIDLIKANLDIYKDQMDRILKNL